MEKYDSFSPLINAVQGGNICLVCERGGVHIKANLYNLVRLRVYQIINNPSFTNMQKYHMECRSEGLLKEGNNHVFNGLPEEDFLHRDTFSMWSKKKKAILRTN